MQQGQHDHSVDQNVATLVCNSTLRCFGPKEKREGACEDYDYLPKRLLSGIAKKKKKY
jgi:hypothetical protein